MITGKNKPLAILLLSALSRLGIGLMLVVSLGFRPVSVARADTSPYHYVATSGNDTGDCSSPALPCRNIQYAINRAASGDAIYVAAGTYTYQGVADPCSEFFPTHAVICSLIKNLTIFGGYSPSSWSVRNPSLYSTVIDGQNTYRGAYLLGSRTATYHIDLEGFTIQNGLSHGPTYLNPYCACAMGGGILVQSAAITFKDMVFRNNRSIGADTGSGDGGSADGSAIRIESAPAGTTSLIQRVTFNSNQSYGGTGPVRGGVAYGALFIFASNVVVEDSVFTNNLAQAGNSSGNGISSADGLRADALGGGIAIENCSGCSNNIALQHVNVTGNQVKGGNAGLNGGGAYGGGIIVEDTPSITITDSFIANNTATGGNGPTAGNSFGGGLQSQNNGEINFQRTTILSNSSIGGNSTNGGKAGSAGGGGLYLFSTTATGTYHATLTNVVVAENGVQQGSGITSAGNGLGGGLVVQGINADITHATFARNRLDPTLVLGQALMVYSSGSIPAAVNLNYSIIADHTGGGLPTWPASAILVAQGSRLTFNRVLFAGNTKDTNVDNIPAAAGIINGLATVQSASSAGFVSLGSPNHDYHILGTSAAKDQAIGSAMPVDIDGQSRPYGPAPDIGADEYVLPNLSAEPNDISAMVDNNTLISRSSEIDVSAGPSVSWTATTNATWVYLGSSGTSQQFSGQTDSNLIIRFAPGSVGQGSHDATITVTSPSAAQTTISVHLLKAGHLYIIFAPLMIKP